MTLLHRTRTLALALCLLALAGTVSNLEASRAQEVGKSDETSSTHPDLPPLLDRELFFGDPEIAGSQVSPDGAYISFLRPYRDVLNIWVKEREAPFEKARPVTADTERPVSSYFWSEDGRYILYVQDKGGNENYHVYRVDPSAKPETDTGVPPAKDLTPVENVRAFIYAVPEATPDQILVGLNDRDPSLHDVYSLDLRTGERTLVVRNDSNVASYIPDLEGTVRLAYRQTPDGGSEILRVEKDGLGEALYTCGFEDTCYPIRFHKDGRHLYITTNRGTSVDLTRLALLDTKTGKVRVVESDPENEVDFANAIFSDKREELVATAYVGDRVRLYPRDKEFARILRDIREELPEGDLAFGSVSNDDRYLKVSVSSDVQPGAVYLYDTKKRRLEHLYDSRPELPVQHLAPMRAVRYPSKDGLEIPAFLTLPKGRAAQDLPAVLLVHGGPWARVSWGYSPFAQFLANRGYAVLQPNFRGSTGYGKAFLNAGNREWGTGAMQDDLSAGAEYLVREGIADRDQIAIMGGSYGGYATLAGLTFTPDLYVAGVDIVGPSNIVSLIESFPAYWGPLMKIWHLRVGDPDDPEDRKRLESQSPLNFATRIQKPLLVIQGANDPRVKKAESDQIVVALRELDRPVEYLVAPDEGHGFAGEENRMAMFAAIEEFLADHLDGRYQQDVQPEIAQRLEELEVDLDSVSLPQPEGRKARLARAASLPKPRPGTITEGRHQYKVTLALPGGRSMEMDVDQHQAPSEMEGRPVWKLKTEQKGPLAAATDTWILDRATLVPLTRRVSQGPTTIELSYADGAVEGTIKAGGQELPIEHQLEAPVFGEDGALQAVLCSLPVKAGYGTTLRTFEVRSQKVRPWEVVVEAEEILATPAGSYPVYRIVVSPLDDGSGGGIYWITRKEPRVLVKSRGSLPAEMGGGSLESILVSTDG